jgi:hypothetical protein
MMPITGRLGRLRVFNLVHPLRFIVESLGKFRAICRASVDQKRGKS